MDLANKNVVILGAARSGLAAAELAQKMGAVVFVSDSAPEKGKRKSINRLKGLGIPFEFGGHSDRVFAADMVILSPGIPQTTEIVQRIRHKGIPVFSEIELAFRFCKSPVIAVTGSNGKTTTTTLLGLMLKKHNPASIVAGNIGSPFSDYVANSDPESWAAVEVSSFQLETIDRFHPRVAMVLNLSPNHLDWYETYQDYVTAKLRIIKNLNADDFIIYDGDDSQIFELIESSPARKLRFSAISDRAEAYLKEGQIFFYNKEFINIADIRLKGVHNYRNIMAAGLAAMIAGVEAQNIRQVLTRFSGVEHRMEHVATIRDVAFINDSKATTIESLAVALQSFPTPIVLIAGGKDKGGNYSTVYELVKQNVRCAVLIGAARQKMADAWQGATEITFAGSMEDAVAKGLKAAQPGDNVLLSPACSSFDMFRDFEDRGKVFKKAVKQLKEKHESA